MNQFSQGINVLDGAASNIDSFFGQIHVFLQLSWIGLFGVKTAKINPETSKWQKVFLSKTNSYLQGNNVLDAPTFHTNDFLQQIHLFHHLSQIGLFGTKWAFLHLENHDFQEVFLSKTNPIHTGKQFAGYYCCYHKLVAFKICMCFINSAE
jgi:hypothetical protein